MALAVAGCGSDDGGGGSSGGGGGGDKLKVANLLPGSASDQGYNADGKRVTPVLAAAVRSTVGRLASPPAGS